MAQAGERLVSSIRAGEDLDARWGAAAPFAVVGAVGIVGGGLVAAVTRPTGFDLGSWLAAFLVLVVGVAQIVLGVGQAWLAADPPPSTFVNAEAVAWNLAAAATIAGSLATAPALTTVGGLAFMVALALFLVGVRKPRGRGLTLLAYRGLVLLVLLSTPVGLALAWVRHG